ncbi:bifunctional 2',3'-cyclic-nucleotide 2'-phosphodiesterase/3'-nucleotidase [Paracoccaceae bacterium Fryx2]|nr:bifunctional 2',3'-cyclic-nucleotide 2'-phosphodiesterase/3'-nucleotidase [Paracoccaceae bacterium Fryx2]
MGSDTAAPPTAGTTLIAQHAFSLQSSARVAHLRIMETTDLHMHVLPYDYYTNRPCDTQGLSRTASLIAQVRAEAANTLLVDNGDFLQGSPMGDYYALDRGLGPGEVHPIFAAMNHLGYDAATLGNHEFNYGLDFLMTTLQGASFPVVSANIALERGASPRRDRTLLPPYVILDRRLTDGAGQSHPIRIGLIGFAPPQILQWDRAHLEGRIATRDIVETAAAWVPQMKEAGADIVIALSHSGIGPATAIHGMENASIPLARQAGIDALVTGHTHMVFPSPSFAGLPGVDPQRGTIMGKPAVMGGFWGSHLGVIDLLLERDAGAWRVVTFASEARPIWSRGADGQPRASVAGAAAVETVLHSAHAETLAWARRPIGRSAVPLHSFFALLAPCDALRVLAEAQLSDAARTLRGTPEADLPLLAATAPFKAGGRGGPSNYTDIPAGPLALRHAADLYIYPNSTALLKLTGAGIAEWLERAAGIFNRIVPGQQDQPLINPDFPSYNFDLIHGLEFTIDPSQPARYAPGGGLADASARRITGLRHKGVPVDPKAEFIVATNSFRTSGAAGFFDPAGGGLLQTGETGLRDVLQRHLAETGTVAPARPPHWRIAPMPGTSVTFDTAPRARDLAPDLARLGLTRLGDAPDGFARFRMAL